MALQLLTTGLGTGTCPFSSSSAPSRLSYTSPTLGAASFGISSLIATSSSPLSFSVSAPSTPLPVICGRGDKKTKRGKRFKHSYGNARPRNKSKGTGPPRAPTPPNPYKKKFSEFEYSDIGELEPVPDFDDE